MALKGKRLYSILWMKCPKCHEGDLFCERNAYKLSSLTKMHEKCEKCGESFSREPGFYFGAAYVSYGLTVALWISCLVALHTFGAIGLIEFDSFFEHPTTFVITGVVALIVLLPPIYRLSRSIWINFFVSYDPEKNGK